MALLADGLRRSCTPSLEVMGLGQAQIGLQGASALAAALSRGALPSLVQLTLSNNQIGDAELAALAPALCQLPALETLYLSRNQIGDRGVAALLAEPHMGVLASLRRLDQRATQSRIDSGRRIAAAFVRRIKAAVDHSRAHGG